jgi:hypothetical protein
MRSKFSPELETVMIRSWLLRLLRLLRLFDWPPVGRSGPLLVHDANELGR